MPGMAELDAARQTLRSVKRSEIHDQSEATVGPQYFSYAVRHISYAVRHISYAVRHISYAVRHISYAVRHISYAMRHISYGMRHISYGMRHISVATNMLKSADQSYRQRCLASCLQHISYYSAITNML